MSRKEQDYKRLIASGVHSGNKTINFHMSKYISHRSPTGCYIINVEETYQKIKLAARAIVTVSNPADVIVVSQRPHGQRAVIKYAHYTGASSTKSSRWTPGTLTNQSNHKAGKFQEPAILIVTDPEMDRQAVVEASYVNIPTIALCNSNNSLQYVDIPIPCDNRTSASISMIYWLLAREVLYLRGELRQEDEWDVLVDLFYHKDITNEQLLADNPVKEIEDKEDQPAEQEREW